MESPPAPGDCYEGYEIPINGLRMRVRLARERVGQLMARQGHLLETVAVAELDRRRDRLETSQNQARFAFADSYDRAAKAQLAPPAKAAAPELGEPGS